MRIPILAMIVILLASCSAEKRLNKLLANHPELHDTIVIHDTLFTELTQHDTTFVPLPGDTVRIDKGKLHVRYVKLAGDTVWLQGTCDPDTVVHVINVDRVGPTRTVNKIPWWIYLLCGGFGVIAILALLRK